MQSVGFRIGVEYCLRKYVVDEKAIVVLGNKALPNQEELDHVCLRDDLEYILW